MMMMMMMMMLVMFDDDDDGDDDDDDDDNDDDDDDDDGDDTNKNNNSISAGDIETCAPWLLQSIVSCAQVVFRCLGSSSGNTLVAQVCPHAAELHVVR